MDTTIVFSCSHNKLISLPELPNCRSLYCHDNKLTYLPQLPKYLLVPRVRTLLYRGNKYLHINKSLAKKLCIKRHPITTKVQQLYREIIKSILEENTKSSYVTFFLLVLVK